MHWLRGAMLIGLLLSFAGDASSPAFAQVPVPAVPTVSPPPEVPKAPQPTQVPDVPSQAPAIPAPAPAPPKVKAPSPPATAPAPPEAPAVPKVKAPSAPAKAPSAPKVPSTPKVRPGVSAPGGTGTVRTEPILGGSAPAPGVAPAVTGEGASGGGSGHRATPRRQPDGGGSRTPAQRRERRLRQAVSRLGGCMSGLEVTARRVLALRAGVGAAPPRSRRAVAALLRVPVSRVARVERRGLRSLRRLARSSTCENATAPDVAAVSGKPAGAGGASADLGGGSAGRAGDGDAAVATRIAEAHTLGRGRDHGGVLGESATRERRGIQLPDGRGDVLPFLIALGLIAAVAAGAAIRQELR